MTEDRHKIENAVKLLGQPGMARRFQSAVPGPLQPQWAEVTTHQAEVAWLKAEIVRLKRELAQAVMSNVSNTPLDKQEMSNTVSNDELDIPAKDKPGYWAARKRAQRAAKSNASATPAR